MLFKYLESLKNNTNEEDFSEILKKTADDIKFNRIGFNKTTNPKKFIEIAERKRNIVCL